MINTIYQKNLKTCLKKVFRLDKFREFDIMRLLISETEVKQCQKMVYPLSTKR